ncbi:MAG: glycosyl transferase group 1 [Candidatus Acidoferrum typicum]|nr:glycosyl transferase group 1 [Candidatus Acidoferrum typicum]
MSERRLRVLTIASHPVQYSSPIFRLMAQHPRLDSHVAYCSLRGAEAGHDPEFGRTVKWDVPLLDGYSWTQVPNQGAGSESFFGLNNPGLWKLIRTGHFDAVICHTGYIRASFWISYFAAKSTGASAFLFGTDATTLLSRSHRQWKRLVKRIVWPLLFRLADQVLVPSSGTRDLILSLGIAHERITLTPYAVDNDWWAAQSAMVDRHAVRSSWGATSATTVILFCAKLQPWKRPADLLRAFAKANLPDALLVFAGEGSLRQDLEAQAASLGISSYVRFLGFVNQSQLPAVYTSADVMVLPSEYEPFAVVVNEAMCCGCPVIVSDRVGAARDLVAPICPQFIFPCGDTNALSEILIRLRNGRADLKEVGHQAAMHLRTWSPERNTAMTVEAIERATARMRGRSLHTSSSISSKPAASPTRQQ